MRMEKWYRTLTVPRVQFKFWRIFVLAQVKNQDVLQVSTDSQLRIEGKTRALFIAICLTAALPATLKVLAVRS